MEGGIVCVSNQYLHFHVTHCQRVPHVPWLDVTCFGVFLKSHSFLCILISIFPVPPVCARAAARVLFESSCGLPCCCDRWFEIILYVMCGLCVDFQFSFNYIAPIQVCVSVYLFSPCPHKCTLCVFLLLLGGGFHYNTIKYV